MPEIDLTTFRRDLTDVIDRLDETGPVRLVKHNDTIAEIRSATPTGDRAYASEIIGIIRYFTDPNIVDSLLHVGIDTFGALRELTKRHAQLVAQGVTFDPYPQDCLPTEGRISIDEALAYFYFGDDYPENTDDPYAWFTACVHLQDEAAKRDMKTELPGPNAYDENGLSFVELAISSGHTPDSLVKFGIRALDQGVQLNQLVDMLGSEPVPADVIALDTYRQSVFESLTENGLPHAEAVAVFRQNLDLGKAIIFAEAGLRTADDIEQALTDGISPELALRAARDGLTPEEWTVQVPKIQHLKYRGAGSWGSEGGVLPFRMLVQASEEKVSLVRWDSNSLKVSAERRSRYFHANTNERKEMYPWNLVYDDRILDLAHAGISPGFIAAFGELMAHHTTWGEHGFAATAIAAKEKGLTAGIANAITRQDSKRPKFTPEQLLEVLDMGLTFGRAHYLAGQYGTFEEWMKDLRQRLELQMATDAFLATVESTGAWAAVKSAAEALLNGSKARYLRVEPHLKEAAEMLLDNLPLDDHQVSALLHQTAYAFGNHSFLPRTWREEHEGSAEEVRRMMKSFDQVRAPAAG